MKKILAATAIGGALFAGSLGLAGPASADFHQDVQFMALLDSHNIEVVDNNTSWGRGVCTDLTNHFNAGWTPYNTYLYAVNSVYDNTAANFTSDNARWFVASAITVYCPWNAPAGSSGGSTV